MTRIFRRHGSPLIQRELNCLSEIANGGSAKSASRNLGLSVKQIEYALRSLRLKLLTKNNAHSVAVALNQGLLMNNDYTLEVFSSHEKAKAAFSLVPDRVTAYDTRLLWLHANGAKTRFVVVTSLEEARYQAGRHITKLNIHSPIPSKAEEYLRSLLRKGL